MSHSGWFGARVLRKEDPRLITGRATHVDDLRLPSMLYARFVRSPYAHARIRRIHTADALSSTGVARIMTGRELTATLPVIWHFPGMRLPPQPLLATDEVRYAGEPVAVVLARSRGEASDAPEQMAVEYEPLPLSVDPSEALARPTPRVHSQFDSDVGLHWEYRAGEPERALRTAPHVVAETFRIQRQTGCPLEPRGAVAQYEPATGQLVLWSTTQEPHADRSLLAECLQLPEHRLRIIAPDVGGGFGAYSHFYRETAVVAYLAREMGRPVK